MYMNDGNKTKINLRNKSVFITGVAGFIGSNLAKRLLSTVEGVKVVGLDNMNHYYDVRLKEARLNELEQFDNFSFVKGNLADKAVIESIFEQYKPEIVVNLGAQAGVRYSITNPDAYVEANLIGFYNILEACRHSYDEGHTPVEHLVYASSSSVYGSNKKVPYSTDDKVDNPVSLYAATKKSNELMAHAYSKLYNIPSTGLRFFTVYGPAGRPDMAYFGFTNKLLKGERIQIFNYGNQQTSEIAAQVGQTPQGWNSSIFSMIRNISDSVVIPIAGIIITLILCYELISMLTERNNLHDVDTWMFFKYFVKMWIAVYLVSHTFDIAMAVFDIGQSVVNSSSGIIRGNTAIDISSLSMQMQAAMATMAIGELVTLALETLVVSWCLKILSVVITVIMYGRMIEIYLYTSLAPIPFATMSNREWGHVGTNYFRGLFALAFQAFLMMVCVAIYAALIGSIRVSSDIHSALFGTMAYTVILCFSLLKTGSLSKQIFGSH